MLRPNWSLLGVGVLVSLWVTHLSGCAASRALDKPAPKNYGVLKPGTNRDLVRAELGQPQQSVSKNDCDVFAFEKGSSGWKYMRAIGYSILDIGTLGVSEVVTNAAEAGVGKEKVRVRVCYDKNQDVQFSERMEVGKPIKLMTGAYPPAAPEVYTVSGGISGLAGTGLVLRLNDAASLRIADNGAFLFPTGVASGSPFSVRVETQPTSPSQTCSVAQGNGTINAANISNVLVNCVTNAFSIWGQVSGLTGGGLVLRNNGAGDLAVAADGAVKFADKLTSGAPYNVVVATQPNDQGLFCTVSGGSGIVGNSDVTTVSVTCVSDNPEPATPPADGAPTTVTLPAPPPP